MLRTLKYFTLMAATALIALQPLRAEFDGNCNHTKEKTSNNYFGVAQFQLTPLLFGDNLALSLLGEIGPKSYRGGGTLGSFYECHQIKVGGEYLGQKMSYNFSSGNQKHWVHQYAVGGRYQYNLGCDWLSSIYIDAESSYAKSKDLLPIDCINGDIKTTVRRHLAGSRFYSVEVGGGMSPWQCANFFMGVGYNDIRYDRDLECRNKNIQGLTVDLEFIQRFCNNIAIDLTAQFRRPYNYAEALIDWHYDTCYGVFSMGIFGGYVWGKSELPNSTTAGVEFGFSFGPFDNCGNSNYCDTNNYCCNTSCCPSRDCQELIAWVSRPAVYMPTVLVVPEERVIITSLTPPPPPCTAPSIVANIQNQSGFSCLIYGLDVSTYFTGDAPITYSFTTSNPLGTEIIVSLDPVTGELIASTPVNEFASIDITVTATNRCGNVGQTFTLEMIPCD